MNSETSTRYGSRVRRHGKSRAARAHQVNKRRVNVVFTFPRSFVFTPFFPSRTLSSPPVPLSALLSSPPVLLSALLSAPPVLLSALLSSPPVLLSALLSSPPCPPLPSGEGGRGTHLSFPLSTLWRRGQGVRTSSRRGRHGVRTTMRRGGHGSRITT